MGAGKVGLLFGERGFNFLARENKGNKYCLAASVIVGREASQSIAAIDELFNCEEQALILRHGSRQLVVYNALPVAAPEDQAH